MQQWQTGSRIDGARLLGHSREPISLLRASQ